MEPEEIAERVIAAVRNNELYVVTHADTLAPLERRFEALLAGYDWLDRVLPAAQAAAGGN